MGGHHHRGACGGQRGDATPEVAPRERIGPTRGLVEKQDLGPVQQRSRHGHALSVSARKPGRGRVVMLPQPEGGEQLLDARLQGVAKQAIGTAEKGEVFAHGEVAIQRELLRHIADAPACLGTGRAQVDARHPQGARCGGQKPAQHAEGRGLAGTVRAQQTEDFPPAHLERGVVHGHEVSEGTHQIANLDDGSLLLHSPGRRRRRCLGMRSRHGIRRRARSSGHVLPTLLPEQKHEGIFQPFGHRTSGLLGGQAHVPAQHPAHGPALGHGIHGTRIVHEACLQHAGRLCRSGLAHPHLNLCLCPQVSRPALGQHASFVQHHDLIAALGFVEIGGADDHAHALVLQEALDDFPQFAARERIDTHRGFIEEEEIGGAHQRAGQPELLFHPAAELPCQASGEAGQVGHVQQPRIALPAFCSRHAMEIGIEIEVFLHRQVFIEAKALGHVTDAALQGCRLGARVEPQHGELARVGQHQARHESQQRGLASAIRADHGGEGPFGHLQGDVVQGMHHGNALAGGAEVDAEPPCLHGPALLLRHPHARGGTHDAWPVPVPAAEPEEGAAPSGIVTVAGMPSRSRSWGSCACTRTS